MSWVLIVTVFVILVYIFTTWRRNKNKTPLPPGPSIFQSLQIVWGMIRRNDIHQVGERLSKRYGDIFVIRVFGSHLVYVNSFRILRKMFTSTDYRDVTNDRPPSFLREYVLPTKQEMAFSNYSENQVKLRKIFHNVVKLYGDGIHAFEHLVTSEIQNLEERLASVKTGQSVDFDMELTHSIIRILYIFLTDERPKDEAMVCSTIENYDRLLNIIFRFDIHTSLTLFPWLRHLPTFIGKAFLEVMEEQERVLDLFLHPVKNEGKKLSGGLLGAMFSEQEHDSTLSEESVKGVIINTVVGGFVTTKGFLSGFFLLMLHYPDIQSRIQNEIDKEIGDKQPILNDRQELHYTNAAILECFRYIRHTTIGLPHMNNAEFEIEGYRIPANSTIITNYWYMARDGKIWKHPDMFKPERFLDDDGKLVSSDHPLRQVFNPFGVGRRNCVGESFAKSRIFLYVTSLLQKFTFLPDGGALPSEDSSTWKPYAALHPDSLSCLIKIRKNYEH
ncbi:cytochrome P450 2D27 [Patella vulgata]|uniref:cytochrome P450 2D27 n=1 Tax=Patella vulgata TaxID=6465 RepID=UPI00217FC907|nr:cytochrome P450 2D27 [Patella vulgata]